MAYSARVVEVMIASPSDIVVERQIIRDTLNAWNVVHARARKALLIPVSWETHSAPELGGRAQQMINDRLLVHCDLLVGIFWTRLGSPTGAAVSGTVEEIEEHIKAGKPAMLYFSEVPVVPGSYDVEQFDNLQEFKDWAMSKGLVAAFSSPEEFRDKFRRDLELNLHDNHHLARELAQRDESDANSHRMERVDLSDASVKILVAAAAGDGVIASLDTIGGAHIQAGKVTLTEEGSGPREAARWKAGIDELEGYGLIKAMSYKREVFELTHSGWEAATKLSSNSSV